MKRFSKNLLTALSAFIFMQGIGSSFFSSEIICLFSMNQESSNILLVQMLGAMQMGWGLLNFMNRNQRYGGIFGRSLLLANLAILTVSGMALLRALYSSNWAPLYPLFLITVIYWSFAFLIFHQMRADPQKN